MTAGTGSGSTFTGSYSSTTGKITFSTAPAIQMEIAYNAATPNSVNSILGFTGAELGTSVTGTNIAVVNQVLAHNIQINGVGDIADSKGNTCTFVVAANANSGQWQLYNPAPGYIQECYLPRASVLNIKVVDDSGTVVSLLAEWYCVLEKAC